MWLALAIKVRSKNNETCSVKIVLTSLTLYQHFIKKDEHLVL